MSPKDSRLDTKFDPGAPCPRCAAPLGAKMRSLLSGLTFTFLGLTLTCDGCSTVWQLCEEGDAGAVKIGNGFFQVDPSKQN